MKQLTKHEYDVQLQEIRGKNEMRERKRSLRTERHKYWPHFKMPTTTKILMAFIFINCTVIEIFAMVAMWHFMNLDALYYLISSVVTESISFGVYCAKSYNETKQEELIKLERDKMNIGVVIPEPMEVDPEPIEASEADDSDAVG